MDLSSFIKTFHFFITFLFAWSHICFEIRFSIFQFAMVLPVDFYQLSRSMLVKVKRLQGVTLRKFKALFGVSPIICSKLWFDILKMDECFQPHHLLWGLFFLKCYATEDVCSIIAQSDNKTFRKWTWRIVHCLSKLNYVS